MFLFMLLSAIHVFVHVLLFCFFRLGKHHQLPPAKSLLHSATVIINLIPVSFIKSLRKEEKDHDDADAEI